LNAKQKSNWDDLQGRPRHSSDFVSLTGMKSLFFLIHSVELRSWIFRQSSNCF